ncbi:beta-galactosidase [Paenibacillus roseipurpureus]|uniref:Beta-galactosidase n=1 Tax=Paenibacillus roseopurpureus TaxID=2918901 RepID=A0AA96RN42_9BACL|nr:beta-galactosidase [Paenibacillus sp. MBLB1832]WNR46939.1 beta-galactosidase [Paenibacillus sp. MBLB1832]
MQPSISQNQRIQLSSETLRIDGNSEIVLCASLFYFRLPRGEWKDRLRKVKAFGYNAIDVYFPWNYHETEHGVWDFSGEKDVAHFLHEASEAGLWVIARPGPYICSEWDGGALPAYLFIDEHMRIRDHDPLFLAHVARWYAQILPILQQYQHGQGGSIIAVQLENELDFYPCEDPHGYISALRDLALQHGILVPLIACAGQGGLFQASGFAEGVVPTCNFYPNDRDPSFEEKVHYYKEELSRRGFPLLVTETNRSHFLLRRLLSAGAKLLGPYLQASGTNFGFTNVANNWGNPLSFLTSDYDFHGMITPEGHIREEAYEGRLLHHILQTYGASLAEATSSDLHRLALKQGGELVFELNVSTLSCPILPLQVPLQTWGIAGGQLDYATAELFIVKRLAHEQRTFFIFHMEGEGEVQFTFDSEMEVKSTEMTVHGPQSERSVTLSFHSSDNEARARIHFLDGHILEIIGMSRSRALRLEGIDENGELLIGTLAVQERKSQDMEGRWQLSSVNPELSLATNEISLGDHAEQLEKHGIYRGFAWYKAQFPQAANYKGIILQKASDVISLYTGNAYLGTVTPGGTSCYLPITEGKHVAPDLTARVEIWGHTNFHDTTLPSLHLNSLKGLTSVVGVTSTRDLNQNWRVKLMQSGEIQDDYASADVDDGQWPIVSIGGWLSAAQPAHHCYRKHVKLSDEADRWILHTPGNFSYAYAYVNGQLLGQVNLHDPFLDLTPFVSAGETAIITVFLDKTYIALSGHITLYEGTSANHWTVAGCQEQGLLQHAQISQIDAQPVTEAIAMKPGTVAWLYSELEDSNEGLGWRVYVSGRDMKLTVFFNGHLVGRLWTKGGENRPIFRGGCDESFYLPGPWFHEREVGNELAIWLEAVGLDHDAILEPFRFVPVSAS